MELIQALAKNVRAGKLVKEFPYALLAKDGSIKRFIASSDANMFPDGRLHFTRIFFRYDADVDHMVSEALARERLDKMALLAGEKDRFIRVMFHEIRTPLHALANCFHTLMRQNPKIHSNTTDEMSYMVRNHELELIYLLM